MIFVTVGVQLPFDRLLRAMDAWAGRNVEVPVIAQTGSTLYECTNMESYATVSGDQFRQFVERAELVVAHAGMGSILTALEVGKPIVVLPRIASLGEHRNDHQIATSRYMSAAQLVHVADHVDDLMRLVDSRSILRRTSITAAAQPSLIDALISFIECNKV